MGYEEIGFRAESSNADIGQAIKTIESGHPHGRNYLYRAFKSLVSCLDILQSSAKAYNFFNRSFCKPLEIELRKKNDQPLNVNVLENVRVGLERLYRRYKKFLKNS